ncbi:hypothetical protein YPPY46_4430 [Yersinia pestis PY-46]|uniref:Esterase n=2 Tax=Yersinia pestis TaxID=632 RepID=A0AAV3BKL0_YERPE|nr:hypothetical protein YPIP275_4500 [Yersinia pestis biovar Orientalis str. IP275]EDR43708.1 hypothetical protein YpE1979001_3838 [Yersinia pestis biovar Antiqua str. E1979001]EDR49831.1 hypothetical protein YpB42003004_2797 [Yersinia pestis biovar Antiqua str. B42003004]EDR64328.1 hypothetical protein YpK1973002_1538 [Yersinia pestis biovar Mediaevalis str. K1973002]EFA47412.1 hypothetical protein YPD27_1646 [Yersinia pestis KIM D27]EIQ83617.1 hypothetical protein YPPY01_4409 [Yersinia pesti
MYPYFAPETLITALFNKKARSNPIPYPPLILGFSSGG